MFVKTMVRGFVAVALVASTMSAQADVFNMPSGDTSLKFVTVGNPGNVADTNGHGSVGYTYQMGEYDVTVGQYCQFLNAVATTSDPYGLYATHMATDFQTLGIKRSGSSGNYSYSVTGSYSQGVNCPIFDASWGDAARFCNWLQNGQPIGAEGLVTTENGAYSLDGATSDAALMAVTRNANATYVIPTEDEWYKAAYFDPTLNGGEGGYWAYPTKSNTAPSNVLSVTGTNNANYYDGGYTDPTNRLTPVGTFADTPNPYGTYDMGGDVWQWTENPAPNGVDRVLHGGSWVDNNDSPGYLKSSARSLSAPTIEHSGVGFRVASVPEPCTLALLFAGGSCLAAIVWRRRRQAA